MAVESAASSEASIIDSKYGPLIWALVVLYNGYVMVPFEELVDSNGCTRIPD